MASCSWSGAPVEAVPRPPSTSPTVRCWTPAAAQPSAPSSASSATTGNRPASSPGCDSCTAPCSPSSSATPMTKPSSSPDEGNTMLTTLGFRIPAEHVEDLLGQVAVYPWGEDFADAWQRLPKTPRRGGGPVTPPYRQLITGLTA